MLDAHKLIFEIQSLSIFSKLARGRSLSSLLALLRSLDETPPAFSACYADFLASTLETGSFAKGLLMDTLFDENLFSSQSKGNFDEISPLLRRETDREAKILYRLSRLSFEDIRQAAAARFPQETEWLEALVPFETSTTFFVSDAQKLYGCYHQYGYGLFARNSAFLYQSGNFIPVLSTDPIRLSDLKEYELQKQTVLQNTQAFLHGRGANNILLYGDKGTGKSSLVKAVANHFADQGLKIIELKKESIPGFPAVCETLRTAPFSFILFIDDLSFSHQDDLFGALKAVLEGGLTVKPANVLIYATSNRRHLVREAFDDRAGNEVHLRDTLEEVVSLSDRFGTQLTFDSPGKDEYLRIVLALCRDAGLTTEEQAIISGAERFALEKGGRSPRCARQYVNWLSTFSQ